MSQTQGEKRDGETSTRTTEAEQCLEREIEKEIAKLKYYLEETDELISSQDHCTELFLDTHSQVTRALCLRTKVTFIGVK